MSTFHIIEDVQEQTTNSCCSSSSNNTNNNSSVVKHQIEKKRSIRTIGNFNSNGTPLTTTTTATASSAKISMTSTAEGKAVVSSLSISLERKDSIQCLPKKIAPCIIPAGQSTVIHLDNYTHFMAQRVTTTKTAIKRSEIITEGGQGQDQVLTIPASSSISESCSSNSVGAAGITDFDFKVLLGAGGGGATSSYRSNNKKTLNMNKQKMLDSKTGTTKVRGRKNSLALEHKQAKEINNMIEVKPSKSDNPTALKPILKKPKTTTNRRKKVIKPRKARTSKVKGKNGEEDINISEETTSADEVVEKTPALPPFTQTDNESKILRPCAYTLQNKKCLSEMTCKFLHSDFPCKYYYLNLQCPQDYKCQFMHNGPLEPQLMEALRSHILDLLTTKPSAVETHFIEQLHNIEDLTQRLLAFQNKNDQPTFEIIEVMDDNDDDQVLVIDESSDEVHNNNFTAPAAVSLRLASNDTNNTTTLTSKTDQYDAVYKNFKETNSIIDEIDLKLQNLKTTSNMTPNQKIHELQNIYELLKEQEKRLPIYENLNTSATSAQISSIYNKITNNSIEMLQTNLASDQQQHIVLVNPEIVNEIQTSDIQENLEVNGRQSSEEFQENQEFLRQLQSSDVQDNIINIADDNDSLTTTTITNLNVPQESGMEFLTNEKLPQLENVTSGNNDMINLPQEHEINDNNIAENLQSEEELTANTEALLNNGNLNDKDNWENPVEKEVQNETINIISNIEINQNSNKEELQFESEQINVDNQTLIENLDITKTLDLMENENLEELSELNNTSKSLNEILELALPMDEKEIIESQIEEPKQTEETEEESPPYEQISIANNVKENRIRLRSHAQQDNEESSIKNNENTSNIALEVTKPIKTRRLRLPKPSQKTSEKTNIENFQINADIINKLINSAENSKSSENGDETKTFLQDAEIPLTQNVILTKRFMKKAKAKLEQQSLLNETLAKTSRHNDTDNDIEQKMFALHSGDIQNLNSIENIDVTLLTQTSEESYSLNPSQDPLVTDDVCDAAKLNNEIPLTSSECCYDQIITPIRNKKKAQTTSNTILSANLDNPDNATIIQSKRRISFENPSSSLASPSTYKEQFNLGNPHVVLTKLKPSYLLQTTQKVIQADSTTTTTTNVNPIVTSSTLLADDNRPPTTQKRRSFTPEYDLDSTLKENKCLKIDNAKSVRKVNFDTRQRTHSEQSNSSKEEGEFDSDSSDEKLTIVDTLQTSTPTGKERKQAFEPATTTHTVVVTHHSHHQHVHKVQQQENESDLRQQIENVSNKSDLQLQIQQRQEKQQKEDEKTTTTATTTSFISENSNNLPHKQYQQGNALVLVEKEERPLQQKQYEKKLKEEAEIAVARNPYGNIEDDGQTQYSSPFEQRIDEPEKPTSNASDKYSKELCSVEMKENVEYSTYSSLYNKLSAHSTKCQINFENSSVNITPISSPTYGDDTIASPSPVRRSFDFRLGGEIDGRLTYPPMPYILHEIDLGRIDINKPICIDKLKKTLQLDPRIFRTQMKKQLMTMCKPTGKTSNALVSLTTSNSSNLLYGGGSSGSSSSVSFAQPTNTSMVSPYDPRNRTPALMSDIATPTMSPQTALTPYNNMNVVAAISPSAASSSSSPYMHTDIPNAVPLALQYHNTAQPILQPQQQQTPNMFLYGCLQRSPWYQSLMSTMKIQINQSISQLVRALNNFHRERLLNPEMVFDVFKIDCAGELLEIMRNLGIFVDANGIINEQRHVPTFGGRSCCNTLPVNATYSFIQQVLTPNTHCTSMTTASSTYNAAGGGPAAAVGSINVNEPFVSCYIKAPEPPVQKHSNECCGGGSGVGGGCVTSHHGQHDDHNNNNNGSNCNRCCNNNNNGGCDNGSGSNNSNNNNGNYNQNNNNNNNRRYGNQFKKPYDNNYNNNNGSNNSNNYQSRSNQQRSSYSNNPRFNKPGLSSPSRSTNTSPPNSPRGGGGGFDSGNSYGAGRGGRSFNNNRRFNNFKNNYDNNGAGGGGGSSWSSSSDTNDRFNKFQNNNNSPPRVTSPNSSFQSGSPRAAAVRSSPPPAKNFASKSSKKSSNDEECWDSDN